MEDESVAPVPNPRVQQRLFQLTRPKATEEVKKEAQNALLTEIEKDEMLPYYNFLLADPSFAQLVPNKPELIELLEQKNKAELTRLQDAEKQAEESEGEVELHTVLRQRAMYLAQIGDYHAALSAIDLALEKAIGLGSKIDLALLRIRLGLFFGDTDVTQHGITQASELIEKGGDWDRRNRLTVYRAVYAASIRDFTEASRLCLEALSTFTTTELMEYEEFIQLTVLMGMATLSRRELKKMMEAPEVLQSIEQLPHLQSFTSSLYNSEFAAFFRALAEVEQRYLLPSRILAPHAQYYVREMRIIAFAQLLESYRSVALDNMAAAFGVTADYIDRELSRFISAGRLAAVIDKVDGVIENRRPDAKNAQYSRIIKEGDVLLNSLQKLSRTAL
ncbi:proteasome regulatory particle subunit [Malassezia yamatoensis]|uniref:Proteasome regulatory particle subunit n=1 Tax=Malassezia yamatoensis TaxID=253288 RepID=A0AAJ5YRK1_9BASI|nr:proteasome regulatory particle subunit [Malassezia yamatoensis]